MPSIGNNGAGNSASATRTHNRRSLLPLFLFIVFSCHLIVLSTLPAVKKIKDKWRCLRLSDKAEAICYDQTLVGWRVGGGEGAAGCEGIIIQAEIKKNPAQTRTRARCKQSMGSHMGEF